MINKWIAAIAAAGLAAGPAAAQARVPSPVEQADSLGGGHAAAWIAALVMVIGAILILTDDDNDLPESP